MVSATPTELVSETNSNDWKEQFLTQKINENKSSDITAVTSNEPVEPETVTGQFGKKFFEQYLFLKQNNLSENPEAIKALIDQTTENVVSAAPLPRSYDVREIVLSTETDASAERAYANNIGRLILTYTPREDAASIANQALEQNDKFAAKKIEDVTVSYDTLLAQLLATRTPKNLAPHHVELINAVSAMSFVSNGMSKVFSDPIQGMVAMALYEQSVGRLRSALLDLKFVFAQQDMQFSSQEPAIVFSIIK
ncbi:MAG: hypothetical protein A3G04_00230 [Candidatus Taylorbacteria bacterium RIFCSPLOWO2_12_FULL_44_9]|nr:MAG: hypothetical protein A3G04_00230 [Candidatus Taylorbacteria bacterium RIFCSPLOWO2_12_FULL_44_9]